MQTILIQCYRPGSPVPPASFFILSRGRNAGRPSHTPNPNCFRVTCAAGERDRYYWLVFALWQARRFEYYLHGSVIPLIRIGDVRNLITEQAPYYARIEKVLPQVSRLAELEENLIRQQKKVREIRLAMLRQATRPASVPVSREPENLPASAIPVHALPTTVTIS
ncbi:DUF6943 family protein [Dinghuibacter silviterrae]|uniref:Type I restriction modification DNA specificity protein n=1 Tax=Dinghuibacter silviterrae TaxID=1539049 RepID=A0A4V3GKV5_9BACT|nr:hypothetical protein [Dinghuibacter silviterrae]TDW97132.1 hypothetical protein EDB95_4973 [Dinghuibacter silviterrae]